MHIDLCVYYIYIHIYTYIYGGSHVYGYHFGVATIERIKILYFGVQNGGRPLMYTTISYLVYVVCVCACRVAG